ncbi:MAG: cell division protein FtsL [Candidatus Kapabacteria bacterium]|nr:cell division protein FtsL [Ignavibacteriota bacterium]MCW5886072.1 cell division protein FtsL [Candidatus Kapabacteria bacterium]
MSILNKIRQFIISLELSELLIEFVRIYRWIIFIVIFVASLWVLLLVTNVRNINSLLSDIRQLEKESGRLENLNERYLYEIVKLQSADRIIHLAEEQLNMEQSQKAPDILK